ncbi:response regulator transcription factor [Spirosoma rigui]|uniref:response regulator transcription factor n=1 Tax=Spirosoma rigui TaxID=564064 RepID=UPI0009B10F24|nr:response regulator transcription factor [Spirosoma rigui]
MSNKHHLLLVDANPYVTGILVQTLKANFDVTVANTGQDAARLLVQGNRFDCVLTELNLPYFSGLELTKLIRTSQILKNTPVVILSNASDSETRIKCLEQGVDSYITKPFNPLEVRAKLLALLRRSTVPMEEMQQSFVAARPQLETQSIDLPKSSILSMILKRYTVLQRT